VEFLDPYFSLLRLCIVRIFSRVVKWNMFKALTSSMFESYSARYLHTEQCKRGDSECENPLCRPSEA